MSCATNVKFVNLEHSAALETHIREKVQHLETVFPHLQSCDVTVDQPHKHHHQGRGFEVRINVIVPGGELVVNHQSNEDAYIAIRDAFDAAKRKLQDFEETRRQKRTA